VEVPCHTFTPALVLFTKDLKVSGSDYDSETE
jgi:hypothetical protein